MLKNSNQSCETEINVCIVLHFGDCNCCCHCACRCVAFVNISWYFAWSAEKGFLRQCRCFSQVKCDEYWPELGTTTTYGHVTVRSQEEEERADFVIRTFTLRVKAVRAKIALADL